LMPEMDGVELSRDAKKISPHTSIVIFTGSVLDAQYAKNIQETADAFLSKPLRLQEMSDILSGFCPEI
jgi:CheY-like chemotaxis protein